jgi:hypothetical protein
MDLTSFDVNGVFQQRLPLEAQLPATLNIIPAHAWKPSRLRSGTNNGLLDFLAETGTL